MVKLIVASLFVVLLGTVVYGSEEDTPEQCKGANEIFNSCGNNCRPGNVCTLDCKPRCECVKGFTRDAKNGTCIKKPSILLPFEGCGVNEIAKPCGVDFTCDNNHLLTKPCKSGCYCIGGYVRDAQNKCIPAGTCSIPRCTRGAVYTTCGGCDQRCNEKPTACVFMCRTGCFCPNGLLRNSEGACVKEEEC